MDLNIVSHDEAVERLKTRVRDEGGIAAFCDKHGFSRSFIYYVYNGEKMMSERLAGIIGLRVARVFTPMDGEAA